MNMLREEFNMSANKITIEIERDHATIITRDESGIAETKAATLEDIQSVLLSERTLETPLLPGSWGTQKFISSGRNEIFAVTTAPKMMDVRYSTGSNIKNFKVPIPAMLWIFAFRVDKAEGSYRMVHSHVHALKNWIMSERDEVFDFPFSNVSDYCCWGSIEPTVNVAKGIANLPHLFMSGVFNGDLDNAKFNPFRWEKADENGVERRITAERTLHLFDFMDTKRREAEAKGEPYDFPQSVLRSRGETFASVLQRFKDRVN
jgi:hypothetical protein